MEYGQRLKGVVFLLLHLFVRISYAVIAKHEGLNLLLGGYDVQGAVYPAAGARHAAGRWQGESDGVRLR